MQEFIVLDLVLAIVFSHLGFGLFVRKLLDLSDVGLATVTNYTKLVTKLLATTLYKKIHKNSNVTKISGCHRWF